MPRVLKLALTSMALALLLAAVAVLVTFALLSTPRGSVFVADKLSAQASQSLGGRIHWQRMSGVLTGPLQLEQLQVSLAGTELEIGSLQLDWHPGALLRGQVVLTQLQLDDIDIHLTATAPTDNTEPFSPQSLRLPIDVIATGVGLRRLNLRQEAQDSQYIDSIQLDFSLRGDQLALQQLQVDSPRGALAISGETRLANQMPLDILVDWTWNPGESAPLSGIFTLKGNTHWSEAIAFNLDYGLQANGLSSLEPSLPEQEQVSGVLKGEFLGERLLIERLALAMEHSAITLGLQGVVDALGSGTPMLDTQLTWRGLHWPLGSEQPDIASAEGTLSISGPLDAYRLAIDAQMTGSEIPAGSWQLEGDGNLTQLELTRLQGQLLDGEINLRGDVQWEPAARWRLQAAGTTLDTGQLLADFPGQVNFRAQTHGVLHPEDGLQAGVELETVNGTLLDYPFALTGTMNATGETMTIGQLQLSSGRNQLQASGKVSGQSLDLGWQLRALDLGELYPGAGGQLRGKGHLSGTTEAPRIKGQLQGAQLQLDGLSIASLDLALRAGTSPGGELALTLTSGPLLEGDIEMLKSLALQVAGSNQAHEISLQAVAAEQTLGARLSGGLNSALDTWQGQLAALQAQTTQFGQWALASAADLAVAADSASLGQACFKRLQAPGQLCAEGGWRADGDSRAAIKLQDLPVALLEPSIGGSLAGQLQAALAADGGLRADGNMNISPGSIALSPSPDKGELTHGGGSLRFKINEKGLHTQLNLDAPENGRVDAELSMPALTALPILEPQPLQGRVLAELPDLSGIAAWVDEVAASSGWVKADLKLAGSLDKPKIAGQLELRDASTDIPMAGLRLQDMELEVRSDPNQTDSLEVLGGLRSGPGQLRLSGTINLADGSAEIAARGNDLQVYNTRDARVAMSPDIQAQWRQETLTLRGDIVIPSADITPKLELNPAMMNEDGEVSDAPGQLIAPSADVVIVTGSLENDIVEELSAPFRIDNQTRLILGESVNVNAVGFMGRITGDVLFTNTPEQSELIPLAKGMLSVEDGTFRAYSQDLDIRTGQLLFNNVPVTEPEINLRAVRWIDNDPQVTSAGILLTGPITTPTMELYSRPQLETSEVQSYLLTGRSTRENSNVLSVGTYVTPRIYVGYGYNTLEKTSEFNSLFTITPRYGVGLDLGEADNNVNMTLTYER